MATSAAQSPSSYQASAVERLVSASSCNSQASPAKLPATPQRRSSLRNGSSGHTLPDLLAATSNFRFGELSSNSSSDGASSRSGSRPAGRRASTVQIIQGVFQYNLLQNYSVWYTLYLLTVIICGALAMLLLDPDMSRIDALYLSVSSVTETGLSSVDFTLQRWTTHVIVWLLIILGSPMLLSTVPVALRLSLKSLSQAEQVQNEAGERFGGMAFFGLLTTQGDERFVLRIVLGLVWGYWLVAQLIGWFLLSLALPEGLFTTLFLATSSFHNAGLTVGRGVVLQDNEGAALQLLIVMALILAGNTCFPIILRFLVKVVFRVWPESQRKDLLKLLLLFPRTCYTHLFPGYATRWLAIVTFTLISLQFVALCLADLWAVQHTGRIGNKSIAELAWSERFLAIAFQSVSTRTAGLSVVDLKTLSPTSAYVFCLCMWLSVCPVVMVMRSTTRVGDHMVSGYSAEQRRKQSRTDAMSMRHQLDNFMSQDLLALLGIFFLILLCEEFHTTEQDVKERRFLYILFEFCSAYGTVGLSMSDTPSSRSGQWSLPAKLLLLLVMLLGRLRGLPESVDPTFRLQPTSDSVLSGLPDEDREDEPEDLEEEEVVELEDEI